jgi:putative metallohydrolase (TIGR04338 family)
MRDFQQSQLYAAQRFVDRQLEWAADGGNTVSVFGSTLTIPLEARFGTIASAQSYIDWQLASPWFKEAFPDAVAPVTIRNRSGDKKAHAEMAKGVIALHDKPQVGASWALRELVVLHELAHIVFYRISNTPVALHGPEFAGVLIKLAENAMGPEIGLLLRSSFIESGVVYTEHVIPPAREKVSCV